MSGACPAGQGRMGFTPEELKNKRIGVLLGGLGEERDVSLRSGEAVARALESRGYRVVRLDVGRDVAARLGAERIDVAVLALHGSYGEDGSIQGVLEVLGIPYTGSGVRASAAAMDKVFSKKVFAYDGLPLAEWVSLATGERPRAADLPFGLPCVVKPSREGSSVGVHVVREEAALAGAVADAERFAGTVLVERYVKGREINVAVLDDEAGGTGALGAIEIVPATGFYDYAAKYTAGTTRYLYPAPLPPEQYALACELGLRAHRALGCEGATRADLILGEDGRFIVLEVNTLPGMTETSLLPKIAAGRGIDFPSLCERLLCGASLKA